MEKRTKRKVAALTLGSFLLLSMVSGCGAKDTTEQEQVDPGVPIEVETAEIQDFDKVVTLGGLTAAEKYRKRDCQGQRYGTDSVCTCKSWR